jgi:hypothetical protein
MPTIYTIGDSHSVSGWYKIPNVSWNHLGPILAFSIGRDKNLRIKIERFNFKMGDTVVFSFGEIDCRCHVFKYCVDGNQNTSKTYKQIIFTIVSNYISAIKEIMRNYLYIRTCIYSIVPPIHINDGYSINEEFPFLGSDEQRLAYTSYFNELLSIFCFEYGFTFIDIQEAASNSDGFLNAELSDGSIHIGNPNIIINALQKNGIIN